MNIPTYPARPISGGPFPLAPEKFGSWAYEPKYNGWRALVHIETGAMFNRKGERLSINGEFKTALGLMKEMLLSDSNSGKHQWTEWADVEALERRHNIGRGCLIVLDVIPNQTARDYPHIKRHAWLSTILPTIDCFIPPWSFDLQGKEFPHLSVPPHVAPEAAWSELQQANKILGCQFYEGLVAKKADSAYPLQLRNPEEAFPFFVKHRWKF